MKKTIYSIPGMDCPSEEQLIRMRLNDLEEVHSLEFDLANRKLSVCHSGNATVVTERLEGLNFGAKLLHSVTTSEIAGDEPDQRRILIQVLAINLFFFLLEMLTGLIANSMGLIADSLDMLADSFVYALALFAVGTTISRKNNVARISGYLQLGLAILGFIEVVRRFIGSEPVPSFMTMIIISLLALTGNALCLYILQKSRSREAHMRASMIFTSNDVIVNIGVIIAGILVFLTTSKYPDLIVGLIVFGFVGKGAFKILRLAGSGRR